MLKKKLRLKIGASRRADGDDSPPATPHSVAPPLSPAVDYELRTACALVLQDFKPSDYVYHERFGDADDDEQHMDYRTQLNYAAFLQALEDSEEEPDTPVDAGKDVLPKERQTSNILAKVTAGGSQPEKPAASSAFSDGLWKRVRGEQGLEDEEAVQLPPRQWVPKSRHSRPTFHQRSVSHPIRTLNPESGATELPGSKPRANSLRTEDSTPANGRVSDDVRGSTELATAEAAQMDFSERTTSHARQSSYPADVESPETPTAGELTQQDTVEGRRVLENRIRASIAFSKDVPKQEANDEMSPVVGEAHPIAIIKTAAPVVSMPLRKPVPRSTSDASQRTAQYQPPRGRTSADLSRSASRRRRSTPRSESRAELEMLRAENKRDGEDSESSPAVTKTSMDYQPRPWRNTGIRAPAPSGNVSAAPSRSRSITRSIREYVRRPGSRSSNHKSGGDVSRPASRQKSMDSLKSAVSALSGNDYAPSRWKSFRLFHRDDSSTENAEVSRTDSTKETESMSKPKGKPPIDLNRELPPLPSLDKWKDEEQEDSPPPVPQPPAHIVDPVNSAKPADPTVAAWSTPQTRSQKPSIDSTASQQPRDSVLNMTPPQRAVYPKRMASLRAATEMSKYSTTDESTSQLSLTAASDARTDASTTRTEASSVPSRQHLPQPDSTEKQNNNSIRQVPTQPTTAIARMHSVAGNRSNSYAAKPSVPPRGKSLDYLRSTSDQPNFSRKLSSDDYNRGHDRNYEHRVDLSAPSPVPTEETKKKRRWWQSRKTSKRSMSWMDKVVKSGSRSGILVADNPASPPIVKY